MTDTNRPADVPPDVEVLETEPVPPTGAQAAAVAKWRGKRKLAWTLAIAADALQIALLPVFAGGLVSPLSDALDVLMAGAMIFLLGWHIAFLPTLVAEFIPLVNLVPTWTAAVWLVTRMEQQPPRTPADPVP